MGCCCSPFDANPASCRLHKRIGVDFAHFPLQNAVPNGVLGRKRAKFQQMWPEHNLYEIGDAYNGITNKWPWG
jgi:hypothetical protein